MLKIAIQLMRKGFFIGCFFCITLYSQQVTFTDVAPSMGIDRTYIGAFFGVGVSFCDFNNDGLDDLTFSSQNGQKISIFRNDGNGFTDITFELEIDESSESKGVLWADYDNDGDKDLFISTHLTSNRLYRNDGDYTFVDVTESAGISTQPWFSVAGSWADYNNDGWLDLYVINYSDEGGTPKSPNWLYENQGDGTFLDVAAAAGVNDSLKHPLAVAFFDYNNDGWQDLYVANDKYEGNDLFKNNGDGTFTDVSEASGANVIMHCMGIAIGDYDNNNYLDLYVTNIEDGNGLLRNNGDGTFTDMTEPLEMAVNRICWGTNFFDFDNDADLDLYVCTSGGVPDNYNVLFENNGDATFTRTTGNGLAEETSVSFSSAIGDFNDDGFCDIAVGNWTPFSLWQNNAPGSTAGAGSNNWVKLELEGTSSNRDGVGSLIEIWRDGEKFIRSTHCGFSFMAQSSDEQTIGIGATMVIDSIIVRWPSGIVDVFEEVYRNQKLKIVEGQPLQQNVISKTLTAGWNLVGLPYIPLNLHYQSIFPNALDNSLFKYNGGYTAAELMETCKGYWLKNSQTESIVISGQPIEDCIISLSQGWNMISGISQNIALVDVGDPGNIIVPGSLYGYEDGYMESDTIVSGNGYWINSLTDGEITLDISTKNQQSPHNLKLDMSQFPALEITDAAGGNQTLYCNVQAEDDKIIQFALPPKPLANMFDARFRGDVRAVKGEEAVIEIQSPAYPITITAHNFQAVAGSQCIIEIMNGKEIISRHRLTDGAQISISNPLVKQLKLSRQPTVPIEFIVEQNYPNPFNPTTEIRYSLPREEAVEITIFNVLGQQIKQLFSARQEAGNHKIVWDGTDDSGHPVTSGLYFYHVNAGNTRVIKKMMLLR